MKINKISSVGTVAVREIEINIKSPIALICGSNRSGKSSLRDGIYHAFTGDNPHDILKKNYGLLVNRDTGNNIGYTYVDYNNGQRACITLPNGTHELTEQLHFALPYVLNPSLFGSISADDRRRLLFDLGNLRSDGAEVKAKLLDRGCDSGKVDAVLPFLKSSFDNAHKHASDKIKEARANWKATTGEVYGDKKAVDWKAPKPEVDQEKSNVQKMQIAQLDKEIEETSQKLGAYVATINGAKARNSEIVRLRESAEMIDRIEAKLKKDRQEVIVWEVKVNDARLFAQGVKPGNIDVSCPCCNAELTFNGKELIKRETESPIDKEAAAKLPEYEKTLAMLRSAVANGERDLVAAQVAKEKLSQLEESKGDEVTEEMIAQIKVCIEELKTGRKQAQESLDLINKNIRLAAEADEKTKKAAGYHADAEAWNAIADALAPNRIPSEMLSAALDPINQRIRQSAQIIGLPIDPFISSDMTIMESDGRLYSFSSKATKLLIDSMIAEAISHVTGIKFFMIDEFDLLDMPSRSAYLNWLMDLVENNEIDTVLLFGTLKSAPTKLPPVITPYWLENGVIQDCKAEAA